MNTLAAVPDALSVVDLGERHACNPATLAALDTALAAVPAGGVAALTARGSVLSSGLDLEWIAANPAERDEMIAQLHHLLARIVLAPAITVAVISGHAFGGGAMLALACDLRVMRADRGYFCFPEVDLDLPPTAPVVELAIARIGRATAAHAFLSGRRFTGPEAARLGLVDRTAPEAELLAAADELTAPFAGKPPRALAAIKRRIWGDTASRLAAYERSRPR